MTDKEFLEWLEERLVYVYGESPNVDFVHKLRGIRRAYDPFLETPMDMKHSHFLLNGNEKPDTAV